MRKPSPSQLALLVSIWNGAHRPRKPGRAIVRHMKGGHYENKIVWEALMRRGLIRESSGGRWGYKYGRVTAAGMRLLGVKANRWRYLKPPPQEWER